ncbi:hypothetical protein HK098_003259 [Nowakowskiella sp. JEL0407]|nr:hypothetical protein HK098_003259 [Nowakowskiella sp. JEL0407]
MVRSILVELNPSAIELHPSSIGGVSSLTSLGKRSDSMLRKLGSHSPLVPESVITSQGFETTETEDPEESVDVNEFEPVQGTRWLKPKTTNGEVSSQFFIVIDDEIFKQTSNPAPVAVAGDVLEITGISENGVWGLGRNMRTMTASTFQMSALRKFSESDSRRLRAKHKRTRSGNDASNASNSALFGESPGRSPGTNSVLGRSPQNTAPIPRNIQPAFQSNLLFARLNASSNLQRSSSLTDGTKTHQKLILESENEKCNLSRTSTPDSLPRNPGRSKYTVMIPYTKQRTDEINLVVGDIVSVDHIFEDTWAEGLNVSTNEFGIFPLSYCVEKVDSQPTVVTEIAAPNLPTYSETNSPIERSSDPEVLEKVEQLLSNTSNPEDGLQTSSTTVSFTMDRQSLKTTMPLMSIYGSNTDITLSRSSTPGVTIPTIAETETVEDDELEEIQEEVIVTAIKTYEPRREDELKLYEGQQLLLVKEFRDGWGLGRDLGSGEQGMFALKFTRRTPVD